MARRCMPLLLVYMMFICGYLFHISDRIRHRLRSPVSSIEAVNRCEVNLAPANSLPSVALASHRGCGNTWMRHLIEQTTGIYSGSLGNSSFMLENGFLGELESRTSGRTVVTKTHGINFKKINMFDKVILIFRNPYRCFLAEFNRQQTGSKTERALATSFNSKAWQSFIHRQFSRWEVFAKNWLTSNLPKLVVHYEDLEDNLIHELRRISRFLNVTSFESRLSCVMKNTEGRFHRTTGNTNHVRINPYTPEMRDRIDDLISKTDKLLQSKGFSPLHKNVNKTIFL